MTLRRARSEEHTSELQSQSNIVCRLLLEKKKSPMFGFNKQMDNCIKLLGEILCFRMQGVEFDNGDIYVDGHKAASDVRDEFVSVTEKLMDQLAQCYNVLPHLDINNPISRPPFFLKKWVPPNVTTVSQLGPLPA